MGRIRRPAADGIGQLQTVHSGHVEVDGDAVKRRAGVGDGLQRLLAGLGHAGLAAVLFKQAGKYLARQRVVIDHQRVLKASPCRRKRSVASPQRDRKAEGAADTGLAGDPDIALHQAGQALADGQPEAGAAKLAGNRGVRLAEGLEELALLFGGHADAGILDIDLQPDTIINRQLATEKDGDRALRGEFDGVADQVDQQLRQTQRIADQVRWHIRFNDVVELQPLFLRPVEDDGGDLVEHVIEPEFVVLQLHLACLDF